MLLLDETIFDIVMEGCKDFNKRVFLPSGAIAGLDSIRAVKDELDSIVLSYDQKSESTEGCKIL